MVDKNPYSAPAADVVPEYVGSKAYGGIGRLIYFLGNAGGYIVFLVVAFAFGALLGEGGDAGLALLGIVFVLYMAVALWLAVARFHNIGRSGWNVLWFIVPLANLYFGWMAIAAPEGYKDHGTLDTAGKIITALYILMFVLSFALPFLAPGLYETPGVGV